MYTPLHSGSSRHSGPASTTICCDVLGEGRERVGSVHADRDCQPPSMRALGTALAHLHGWRPPPSPPHTYTHLASEMQLQHNVIDCRVGVRGRRCAHPRRRTTMVRQPHVHMFLTIFSGPHDFVDPFLSLLVGGIERDHTMVCLAVEGWGVVAVGLGPLGVCVCVRNRKFRCYGMRACPFVTVAPPPSPLWPLGSLTVRLACTPAAPLPPSHPPAGCIQSVATSGTRRTG